MLTHEQIAADRKLCEECPEGPWHVFLPPYLAEVERLSAELKSNSAMLAKQCDLARMAEAHVLRLSAEVDRLKDALQSLHDYQNGPPLPSYEKPWGEAMRVAEQLLAAGKEKP